jgi:hypothetical protein
MQPQISAEYDNTAAARIRDHVSATLVPDAYLNVEVTIDRARTYESVLTAFAGQGQTVVFEEFPRDARRAVRVEKRLDAPGTAYSLCRCRTHDGEVLTTTVVCEISIPDVRDVFSFL